jgi:serine/threonine-protein kinase
MSDGHVPEDWWTRVSETLERVVSTPPDARPAILDALARDNAPLRNEVESLLRAFESEGGRFEEPAVERLIRHDGDADVALSLREGARLGPYLVVRPIGRGGMGSVFEAYRADDDFRKRVAIKTITYERAPALLNRFRRERRILAQLEHRNIAALLDGGVLPNGAPYFAMEFVEGQPVDEYCDAHRLSLKDRLQLMRQVCGAVHFAHRNLIVHRDLKPGNILVTADGTVKLLDFGIAKLIADDEDSADNDLTGVAAAPFTLAYASPEQLRGEPVTTASDVYALGVVLFKVVTGSHPLRDADTTTAELRARILRGAAPSTGRGEEIDAIVAAAMNVDVAQRYVSAEQFSEDLRRFIEGLPVRARPDARGYRMRKFVQRHRVSVTAVAAAALAMTAALFTSVHQARVAAAERDRARVEAAKATRITEFVQQMLRAADPREAKPDISVADALTVAAKRADSSLASEPEVLSAVQTAIGLSYLGLGRYDDAQPLLQRALALRQRLPSEAAGGLAASYRNLAVLYSERGELAPAESLFRASLYTYRSMSAPDSAGIATVLNDLADLLQYKGDLGAAAAMQRDAIAIRTRREGPRSESLASSINALAVITGQQGRWAVAESLSRSALSIETAAHGERHPDVAAVLNSLAFAVATQGRVAQAESLYRAALSIRVSALGADHPETARTYMNLGWLLHDSGRFADATTEASRVLALRAKLGDDHPAVGSTLILRGQSFLKLGKLDEGEADVRDALRIREKALPPGHWLIAASRSAVAEALTLRAKYAEAERLLLGALATLRKERGEDAELTVLAKHRLVTLYDRWGKPGEAAKYRAVGR